MFIDHCPRATDLVPRSDDTSRLELHLDATEVWTQLSTFTLRLLACPERTRPQNESEKSTPSHKTFEPSPNMHRAGQFYRTKFRGLVLNMSKMRAKN